MIKAFTINMGDRLERYVPEKNLYQATGIHQHLWAMYVKSDEAPDDFGWAPYGTAKIPDKGITKQKVIEAFA